MLLKSQKALYNTWSGCVVGNLLLSYTAVSLSQVLYPVSACKWHGAVTFRKTIHEPSYWICGMWQFAHSLWRPPLLQLHSVTERTHIKLEPWIIVFCPHFLWTKLATVAWKCPTLSLYWEDVPAWIIDHHARGNFPACVDGVSNQTLLYRIYLRIHSRFRDGAGRSSTGAFVELILFSFSAYCKTHPLNGAEDVVKHFSSM